MAYEDSTEIYAQYLVDQLGVNPKFLENPRFMDMLNDLMKDQTFDYRSLNIVEGASDNKKFLSNFDASRTMRAYRHDTDGDVLRVSNYSEKGTGELKEFNTTDYILNPDGSMVAENASAICSIKLEATPVSGQYRTVPISYEQRTFDKDGIEVKREFISIDGVASIGHVGRDDLDYTIGFNKPGYAQDFYNAARSQSGRPFKNHEVFTRDKQQVEAMRYWNVLTESTCKMPIQNEHGISRLVRSNASEEYEKGTATFQPLEEEELKKVIESEPIYKSALLEKAGNRITPNPVI